ncbi:MAG: MFS transporter [Pseudomonadota bacterium]
MLTFLRSNARWLAGGFLLTVLSGFGQTFFISLWAPEIKATFGLTDGSWGWAYMIATLGSAITLVQLGRVVDSARIAHVAVAVCLALAAASFAMSQIAGSVIWLIATVYALRLFGQGMLTHTSMTAMGRWYVANRGRAVSIAAVGHQGSELIFPLAFVGLAALVGWRGSWVTAALVLVAFAPILYWLLHVERDPVASEPPRKDDAPIRHWTRSEVLRDPPFYLLLAGLLSPAFIGTSVFFHQAHLMEMKGLSRELFAAGLGLMAIVTFTFALVAGALVDRFTAVRIARFYLLPLGAGCAVLSMVDAAWGVMGFMVLMGVSYGFSSTITGAVLPEIYGTQHLGSIRAVVVASMVLLTAAGPGLTGSLIDAGITFETQLLFMAGYCLFATSLLVRISIVMMHRLAHQRDAALAGSAALR